MTASDPRPPIPAELERAILVEAGHRCAIHTCRESAVLELHHITPWSRCHEHKADNLIALCRNCHGLAEARKIDRKALLLYKARLQRLFSEGSAPPTTAATLEGPAGHWHLSTRTEVHDGYPRYEGTFEYPTFDDSTLPHAPDLNVLTESLITEEVFGLRRVETSPYVPAAPQDDWSIENDASSSFEVMLVTKELASVRFQVYRSARGAPHPSHYVYSLNFQWEPGIDLSIGSVLHPVVAGLAFLREYVAQHLALTPENPFYQGLSPDPKHYSCFNVTQDALLLTFQEYQVAPYVAGAVVVPIPWHIVLPHLNPRTAVYRFALSAAA